MGYGFDLHEWVSGSQLQVWHNYMTQHLGWPHLLGGRASKNQLNQLYEGFDYSGYEQHKPDYDKYVETIEKRPQKPSFSEDRFRIRDEGRGKDYTFEEVRRGLWHSAMAGGVANIWGNLLGSGAGANDGVATSAPFPNPEWIKTNARFFEDRLEVGIIRCNHLTNGVCLKSSNGQSYLFYKENTSSISLNLSGLSAGKPAIAVDTRKAYQEINLGLLNPSNQTWNAPRNSDWAIAVGDFTSAPTAVDDSYTTLEDVPLVIGNPGVLGNDVGGTLSVDLDAGPRGGNVVLELKGGFTYTPDSGFLGSDSFTYHVNDGGENSNTATVTIVVSNSNLKPLVTDDGYGENQNNVIIVAAPGVLENDTDPNTDLLTSVLDANPSHGTVNLLPDGGFTYLPQEGFSGKDTFTYHAHDGELDSDTATVTLTINGPPVAVNDSVITGMDGPVTIAVLGNDTDDGPLDPGTATLERAPTNGTASVDSGTGDITYIPSSGFIGTDTLTYTVADMKGLVSNEATVFVNVVDGLPLSITNVSAASGKTYQVIPGGLHQGVRVYIDRTYTYTTIPGELQDATYMQTANADKNSTGNNFLHFSVNQSVTVLVGHDRRITDIPAWLIAWTPTGESLVTTDTTFLLYSKTFPSGPIALGGNHESQIGKSMYSVVVLGGVGSNQSPVANKDSATTVVNTPVTIAVLANDTDDGGLNLGSVAVQSTPSHGSTSVDPGTGVITYTPNPDSLEGDIFTYAVQDTTGLDSNVATVTVTVTDGNLAPVAEDESYSGNQDSVVSVGTPGVLINDQDGNGDLMTAVLDTNAANGVVSLQPDGSFTYTPNSGFSGADGFMYHAHDSALDSNVATVTLVINGAPLANDDSATTVVNTPVTIAVLANDTDDGGLNLGSVAVQSGPSQGTTSVEPGTGTITYTPNPGFMGSDMFTYSVQDTSGLDSMATVRVTVRDVAARVKAGLVVYYPLTEGAGNTVGDQSNVGTPMGLTLSGDVSWATDGNGLVFSNGQVQSSGAATKLIDALQSTNQGTIEVWITPANLIQTGPARILSIGGDTTKQNLIVGQQSNDLAIRLLHTGKDHKAKPRLETDSDVLTTGLLHIVHVYDGTTEVLYVNGVEQPETVVKSGGYSNWDVTDPFTLGNEGNGNRPWAGTLRMMAAYDRPLSPSEVQQNFEVGALGQ